MELAMLVYGVSFLSNFMSFLVFVLVALVLIVIFKLIGYTDSKWDKNVKWEDTVKSIKKDAVVFLIIGFCAILIPSQKTMYVMVGAYAAQKVAQSPETKVISEKVLKIIEIELDEQINEVKQTAINTK